MTHQLNALVKIGKQFKIYMTTLLSFKDMFWFEVKLISICKFTYSV